MPDSPLVAVILGLFGGAGGIAAIITAIASWRKGVRDADVQDGRSTVESASDLIDRLETRLDKVEARLTTVEEELSTERTLKWLLVRYAQGLLDYISRFIQEHDAPTPPEPIQHYFPSHFPSRKDQP